MRISSNELFISDPSHKQSGFKKYIWSCTLSYKNCHLTLYAFNTILTIFAKFKYYFDFDKSAISLQCSKDEELCHFPIFIER